jgi:predicted phage baseplate assembly protein
VVEIEVDGTTYLRFGDDRHGLRPDPGTHFIATYRVGNGVAGNIGRDALYHIVTNDTTLLAAVKAIANPMPASGGCEPDSVEQIRQHAAGSLTEQARGVTPQDYITLATQDPQVHRANALLRWTGSWYTVFLVVERENGLPVDDAFEQSLRQRLEQYRMAGTDLVIVSPVYVPLEITMTAYYKQGYLPGDVETALLKAFSNQQWPDGERGFFYPDNFGFGQPVYLNELYVAASAVPGIERVDITTFQRQDITGTGLKDGVLPMDWLEIAMLENNPRYPERGLFRLMLTESEAQYVRS